MEEGGEGESHTQCENAQMADAGFKDGGRGHGAKQCRRPKILEKARRLILPQNLQKEHGPETP